MLFVRKRLLSSGLRGESGEGRFNRGLASWRAVRSLEYDSPGLGRKLAEAKLLFRKRWALEFVDGVEGGWLGDTKEVAPGGDGKPGADIIPLDLVMLCPPHFGHFRFSVSPLGVEMLLDRPPLRGWYL